MSLRKKTAKQKNDMSRQIVEDHPVEAYGVKIKFISCLKIYICYNENRSQGRLLQIYDC